MASVERLADEGSPVRLVTADEWPNACPACGVVATRRAPDTSSPRRQLLHPVIIDAAEEPERQNTIRSRIGRVKDNDAPRSGAHMSEGVTAPPGPQDALRQVALEAESPAARTEVVELYRTSDFEQAPGS